MYSAKWNLGDLLPLSFNENADDLRLDAESTIKSQAALASFHMRKPFNCSEKSKSRNTLEDVISSKIVNTHNYWTTTNKPRNYLFFKFRKRNYFCARIQLALYHMNILLLGSGGREHALAMENDTRVLSCCDKLFVAQEMLSTA